MRYKGIVVLIPTLNEAKAIGQTIDDVQEYLPECQVLILDSYSINGTADIARDKGAIVINAVKGGKGIAVRSVLPQIIAGFQADYYVMIDGDFTYPAKHLPEVVRSLDNGADVVIGYRAEQEKGAMTYINTIGNRGLSILASMLYGVGVKDVCSGMWGFRRKALSDFNITSVGFTLEADLFINTVKGKYKLAQLPIEYRARLEGSEAKLSVIDGLKIGWFLIKRRFTKGGLTICGHSMKSILLHELLHFLYSLVFSSVVGYLMWGISLLPGKGGVPITSTNIFWWLGLLGSLSVVGHWFGDEVWKIPISD